MRDCAEGGFIWTVAQFLERLIVVMGVLAFPSKRMDLVESLAGTAKVAGKRNTVRQGGASMRSKDGAVVEGVGRAVYVGVLGRTGQGVEVADGVTWGQQQEEASVAKAVNGIESADIQAGIEFELSNLTSFEFASPDWRVLDSWIPGIKGTLDSRPYNKGRRWRKQGAPSNMVRVCVAVIEDQQ